MRLHFKKLVYLIVLAGFSLTHAGSFEDFFIAIKRDNAGTIQSLLKRGFDGNTSDEQGQSGLYLALKSESLKAANTLLDWPKICLLYTSPSPRDRQKSRMPSSA